MNPSDIVKKLIAADKYYYKSGHTIMSDQEYDTLKSVLKQQEPDHPYLAEIGHEPSKAWKKASHHIPMGSLDNVFNKEEFIKWSSKFPENTLFTAQPKLDGLSLSLIYENEHLVRAITRGDGFEGEDITPNALKMQGIPEQIRFSGSVRGEILLNKTDFNRINTIFDSEKKYKNARNAASGISRRLDGKFSQYLQFVPYDITDNLDENKKIEKLQTAFKPPQQIIGHVELMIKAFEDLKERRDKYLYGIDGMVIKVCSKEIQNQMGSVNNRPRAQIAWKFEAPGAITTLKNVFWDVGRTGVITPLGHIEPVEIDGSTIKKVTLHNIAEIKRLGIGLGDTVMLVKAGDIIPKILQVLEHKNNPIIIPETCPSCGSYLENDEIRLFCRYPKCPRKEFNRILNWIKVVKLDDFGESLVKALHLDEITDIYFLNKEDIASLYGWGEKSAQTIYNQISKSAESMKTETFLSALGIPGLSTQTAIELVRAFKNIDGILDASEDDIKALKGFSDISAANIVSGLNACHEEITKLRSLINISDNKPDENKKLNNMSFCFTGQMEHPRKYYQDIVELNGGINKSTVTQELTYLVCNKDHGSTKSKKAKKYGIKIINEKDFLMMVDKLPEKKKQVENIPLF